MFHPQLPLGMPCSCYPYVAIRHGLYLLPIGSWILGRKRLSLFLRFDLLKVLLSKSGHGIPEGAHCNDLIVSPTLSIEPRTKILELRESLFRRCDSFCVYPESRTNPPGFARTNLSVQKNSHLSPPLLFSPKYSYQCGARRVVSEGSPPKYFIILGGDFPADCLHLRLYYA